jgi:hypothetical protein
MKDAMKLAVEQFVNEMKPVAEAAVKEMLQAAVVKSLGVLVGGVVAATENKIDDAFFALIKDEAELKAKEYIATIKF